MNALIQVPPDTLAITLPAAVAVAVAVAALTPLLRPPTRLRPLRCMVTRERAQARMRRPRQDSDTDTGM